MISIAAEEKLASNPNLSKLTSMERIVSMNHVSETYVPPIEDRKYNERNYMQRSVVRPSDLSNLKGGDVIDLLSKPISYAGGSSIHVTNKGPLYNKNKGSDSKMSSIDKLASPQIEISGKKTDSVALHSKLGTTKLPDLVGATQIKQIESKDTIALRNKLGLQSKTIMEVSRASTTDPHQGVSPIRAANKIAELRRGSDMMATV